jgi:hypothetical protein
VATGSIQLICSISGARVWGALVDRIRNEYIEKFQYIYRSSARARVGTLHESALTLSPPRPDSSR